MTRPSSQRRVFRASVVSVTAAFAPALGCVSDATPSYNNPPYDCAFDPLGCAPMVGPDAGEQCPSTATPVSGSACEGVPDSGCLYGPDFALCEDGGWRVERVKLDGGAGEGGVGEGGTNDARCPERSPSLGSACSVPASLACDYDRCYGAHPTVSARCEAGKWALLHTSCNPPSVPCPEAQPAPGIACENSWGGSICSYGACDTGGSAATLACIANTWTTAGECPSACPTAEPTTGTACWHVGDPCRYGDCYGAPTISADCREGKWQVSEATCNPPAPEL